MIKQILLWSFSFRFLLSLLLCLQILFEIVLPGYLDLVLDGTVLTLGHRSDFFFRIVGPDNSIGHRPSVEFKRNELSACTENGNSTTESVNKTLSWVFEWKRMDPTRIESIVFDAIRKHFVFAAQHAAMHNFHLQSVLARDFGTKTKCHEILSRPVFLFLPNN